MNALKGILKMLGGFLIGGLLGLLIAGFFIVMFGDSTWSEYFGKLMTADKKGELTAAGVAIICLVISFFLLVVIHEAGHLVCGLASGYKFVSFRILNYTFIKLDGKLKIKNFSIAGTGGQCLLSPPDLPLEQIPTGWYNIGGVLANVIVLLIALPLLLFDLNVFVRIGLAVFIMVDVLMLLMNGIPLKIGGFSNDANNMLLLRKNLKAKRSIMTQLETNALIQSGIRPKDMPDKYFTLPNNIDYKNPLEAAVPLMCASRHVDEGRWEDAYRAFSDLYSNKDVIMGLYVKEIACELAFLCLVTGRMDEAQKLLDKSLLQYIKAYRKVMSSKERILCAIELYQNNNYEAAKNIYDSLYAKQEQYLLQGEVKSDLAIMQQILQNY